MRNVIGLTVLKFVFVFAVEDRLLINPGKKLWYPTINFTNPSDWMDGNLPSSCDRAVLPPLTSMSIFLDKSFSVQELVLPLEGEIVMSDGISLIIGANDQDCQYTKDVQYFPSKAFEWYEPSSWFVPSEKEQYGLVPIPESERVPCQYDSVEFPMNSSYRTSIGGPSIKIKELCIDGQLINTSHFESTVRTESGKLHFTLRTSLGVTNRECTNTTGCNCRDIDLSELICRLSKCKEVECSDPVKPIGGCCPICGAVLITEFKSDFEFARLQKLYSSYINMDEYKNVYGYMSKIGENRIQAVFSDNVETHQASVLAVTLSNDLNQDIARAGIYGVSSVKLQISSHWLIHSLFFQKGLSVGEVFALSIGFVCILFLSGAAYVAYQKYGFGNLTFRRLQEDKDYDDVSDAEQVVTPFAPEEGIENPLYGAEKKEEQLLPEAKPLSEKTGIVSTEMRENPAFGVFEELEHLHAESLLE